MSPVEVLGKSRQEAGCGDGAGFRATDVGDVGERAIELFLVLIEQRQLPGAVVGGLAGAEQLLDQFVVIAQQARSVGTQGNDARAGQGRDVDHGLGLEALGVGQGIAQHQAAFGVGVEDLHSLAAHGGDDIAWASRAAARHVLGTGQNAHQVDRQLEFQHGTQGAEHAGGAAHVVLHLVHAGTGLEADTAGIEGNAFTYQGVRLLGLLAAVVLHHDQAWRLVAALAHGIERAHAQVLDLLLVQHFNLQALELFAQCLGLFAQECRVADVRRQVAQVASE